VTRAWRILIEGAVQGRGVRPALARLAQQQRWQGRVRNTAQGVELLLVQGDESLAGILATLRAEPVLQAAVLQGAPCIALFADGFQIETSTDDDRLAAVIPVDVATCSTCLDEFDNSSGRRHHDGLISCVACGPRYSVITRLPYDRERTTLAAFPLCAECAGESNDLSNRRSHAQTIGCPVCGPAVWAADAHGVTLGERDTTLQVAARVLSDGGCVALRGLGGYQLLVDARSTAAVTRLRSEKRRPVKPFAVLCSPAQAEQLGDFDHVSRVAFRSSANPIVLVPRRATAGLADGIAPQLHEVGLLAPTTALHHRLLALCGGPLVCTSGNVEGEPLAVTVEEAERDLAAIVHLFVHHARPIAQPVDDSVVRSLGDRLMTLRCARGLAPLPLSLTSRQQIVALGGHQKAAIALANGEQAVLLPHVGTLSTVATRDRWRERLQTQQTLYNVEQPVWVLDAHPEYFSSRFGKEQPGLHVTSWHHHAHIAAGMLEHQWLDRTVLGVAWDGSGWGTDGTLWGGEFLRATTCGFQRVARLRPFALIGGDRAVTQIARTAVSLLTQVEPTALVEIAEWLRLDVREVQQWSVVARSRAVPQTSSIGRLFDGIAALVLHLADVHDEGDAALRLEALCTAETTDSYPWGLSPGNPLELDWRPLVAGVLADLRRGTAVSVIAGRFHFSLVQMILAISRKFPDLPVVLGGGVFQNRRLIEILRAEWSTNGPPLGLPGRIPPNDGGLAAGQLVIAAATLAKGK
jgi:hydrogenase maturation protein HypF